MLTFKKLKFYDELTEETNAFTAAVYWKGVFIGHAENTGKGGMTNLQNWNDLEQAVKRWISVERTKTNEGGR